MYEADAAPSDRQDKKTMMFTASTIPSQSSLGVLPRISEANMHMLESANFPWSVEARLRFVCSGSAFKSEICSYSPNKADMRTINYASLHYYTRNRYVIEVGARCVHSFLPCAESDPFFFPMWTGRSPGVVFYLNLRRKI